MNHAGSRHDVITDASLNHVQRYRQMFDYERRITDGVIRLESMDYDLSYFKLPRALRTSVLDRFDRELLGYADLAGLTDLREAISAYETRITGLRQCQYYLQIGNGTAELLHALAVAICNLRGHCNRHKFIVLGPTYPLFAAIGASVGRDVEVLSGDRDDDFVPPIELVEASLDTATCAIVFAHPSMPSGTVYSAEYLSRLIAAARANGVFVISDEIYAEMYRAMRQHVSVVTLNGGYEGMARLFGPSKDRPGTTGLRIGYCACDPVLEKELAAQYMLRNFSINILAQVVFARDLMLRCIGESSDGATPGETSLRDDYLRVIEHNRVAVKALEGCVIEACQTGGFARDWIVPQSGNSVLVRYRKDLLPDDLVDEFLRLGVFSYPGSLFRYPQGESWFRVCLTRNRVDLEAGLIRLQGIAR